MHDKLIELKCKLAQDNNIFGANAFYYKDSNEFKNGGLDDNKINMFYIRPLNLNATKFNITGKNSYDLLLEKARFRSVFQITKKIEKYTALESIKNQLLTNDNITLFNYSDDNLGIYKAEHDKEKEMEQHHLFSFDFDYMIEFIPVNCECLTIDNCQ